jgi:hypothetical protein
MKPENGLAADNGLNELEAIIQKLTILRVKKCTDTRAYEEAYLKQMIGFSKCEAHFSKNILKPSRAL